MAVDPTKINYSSEWDIDQLVATNANAPGSIGAGITSIYTIPPAVPLPDFKIQFKPTGSAFWFENGTSSTDGTTANLFTFSTYVQGTSIIITTSTAGTLRYFVWADKFNY